MAATHAAVRLGSWALTRESSRMSVASSSRDAPGDDAPPSADIGARRGRRARAQPRSRRLLAVALEAELAREAGVPAVAAVIRARLEVDADALAVVEPVGALAVAVLTGGSRGADVA